MHVFYENMRQRREELGISQTELAELLGYNHRSSVCDIENGRVDLPLSRVSQIAEVLKVPITSMINDKIK